MKLKNNAKKKKRENLNKKMAEKSLAYTTVKSKAKKKKATIVFGVVVLLKRWLIKENAGLKDGEFFCHIHKQAPQSKGSAQWNVELNRKGNK